MRPTSILFVAAASLAGLSLSVAACRTSSPQGQPSVAHSTPPAPQFSPAPDEAATSKLVTFADDAAFDKFMSDWRSNEVERLERMRRGAKLSKTPPPDGGGPPESEAAGGAYDSAPKAAQAAPAPPSRARAAAGPSAQPASITNNQHANVDEGDIVKLHGNHLVVLRRGRLFTLDIQHANAAPSAMLDAFGPSIDPAGTWYDEMVIDGDEIAVIGFSYARGGTEIGLFHIDASGSLHYRDTYHLRSNDYYSARNYASRVVGGQLIFYAPMYLSPHDSRVAERMPAVRRWHAGAKPDEFMRTLRPTRTYHLEDEVPSERSLALHTVTSCNLHSPSFECESTAIMGPAGRVFYVSESSVYVWMREWSTEEQPARPPSLLAKIPLAKGTAVTAIRTRGMPTDQFSFEEADGHLNVLLRAESNGDAMFASEETAGQAAILRVPLALFGDGVPAAGRGRYRRVPEPKGYSMQNRFVGDWLLYGSGNGYWARSQTRSSTVYATRFAESAPPIEIDVQQGVDRIEPLGDNALVVGQRGSDLVFTPLALGKTATPRRDYVRADAAQGELRSHGFFYKPASTASANGKSKGMLGLPIRSAGARGSRYLVEGSASVLFLGEDDLTLREIGSLEASSLRTVNDGCRASCVDWYGNARPIFLGDRVFALMGYELVEGALGKTGLLSERARLDFSPRGARPTRTAQGWED